MFERGVKKNQQQLHRPATSATPESREHYDHPNNAPSLSNSTPDATPWTTATPCYSITPATARFRHQISDQPCLYLHCDTTSTRPLALIRTQPRFTLNLCGITIPPSIATTASTAQQNLCVEAIQHHASATTPTDTARCRRTRVATGRLENFK